MDLVYGFEPPGASPWRGLCGHSGVGMTVDAEGVITCHHILSEQHTNPPGFGPFPHECSPDRCKVEKCGRTYTEADVMVDD